MSLKEDRIPVNEKGRPDLSGYTDSADYYVAMHQQYLDAVSSRPGQKYDAKLAFRRRAHATWGLIAKGPAAVPHAVTMLTSKHADAREDGAAILAAVGMDDGAVGHVLRALASETDPVARDSLIVALGAFKNRIAIPVLADLIRNEATDSDTRWTAVESLGRIVRRRFLDQPEPVTAALEWLDKHENRKA
jgi:HEAT repeat protein